MWKVQTLGEIHVGDTYAELEMKGFARGINLVLNGSGELENGEKVRLFLRGHFAPTPESGVFAIAFTQAGVHNINTGERIPLMHVGSVEVFPTVDVEPVPLPAVVTAVKERVSPSISVSLAITSLLVREASSKTVKVSSTATGVSFTAVTVTVNVPVASVRVPSDTV